MKRQFIYTLMFVGCSLSLFSVEAYACKPAFHPPHIEKSIEAQPNLKDETSCLEELVTEYRTDAHYRLRNRCDDALSIESVDCVGVHCVSLVVEPNEYFDVNDDLSEDSEHTFSWTVGDKMGVVTITVTSYPSMSRGCGSEETVCSQVVLPRKVNWSWVSILALLVLCSVRQKMSLRV